MNKMIMAMRSLTIKDFKEIFMAAIISVFCAVMLTPSFAFAADQQKSSSGGSLEGVLGSIGNIAAIIGAIILVIVLVVGIKDFVKGNGSIGPVIVKALCIFLLIGLIFVATHITTLQGTFENIAQGGVDVVNDTASSALSGNTTGTAKGK